MAYKYSYDDERTPAPPVLPTDRSVWKFLLFSILTLGLYSIMFFIPFSFDLDKIAPKRGQSGSLNYLTAYILSLFTFAIILDIWHYQTAAHMEEALSRRQIPYAFGTGDFWGWYIFGSLIFIGPIVYLYKLCKAMNLLCADYNTRPYLDH